MSERAPRTRTRNATDPKPVDTRSPEDQAASAFLVKFQKETKLHTKHRGYFDTSAKPTSLLLKEIKDHYKFNVIQNGWTPRKYAAVLLNIIENYYPLDCSSMIKSGKLYDDGKIPN